MVNPAFNTTFLGAFGIPPHQLTGSFQFVFIPNHEETFAGIVLEMMIEVESKQPKLLPTRTEYVPEVVTVMADVAPKPLPHVYCVPPDAVSTIEGLEQLIVVDGLALIAAIGDALMVILPL